MFHVKRGRTPPSLSYRHFSHAVQEIAPEPLSKRALQALYAHYNALRQWSTSISLVGPGTLPDFILRHYGESLAALPCLERSQKVVVDLGSGAGFPGIPIAAARPECSVILVESRFRKWLFLESVRSTSGLSLECRNARLQDVVLEDDFSQTAVITCRALKISSDWIARALTQAPQSKLLLWTGNTRTFTSSAFQVVRRIPLEGSENRVIAEIRAV